MSPIRTRRSSLSGFDRVEFNLQQFRNEVAAHGYKIRWSKANFCPNRDPKQEDHHRVSCDLCDRNGFIYYDPIDTNMHVTSFGANQLFMPESRYQPGTAYFTSLPEHKLSFWDKVEMLDAEARFSQVKEISGTNYQLKYPAVSVTQIINNAGAIVPDGDITVELDGTITLANAPSGNFLAFSFVYRPVYIIVDLLHQVRDSRITQGGIDVETDFPHQGVGRLDFLVNEDGS